MNMDEGKLDISVEFMGRDALWGGIKIFLGIVALIIVTVFLLMRPKPTEPLPSVVVEPTQEVPPTVTPLPTATPFPTFTPLPSSTPAPTLTATPTPMVSEIVTETESDLTENVVGDTVTYTVQSGDTLSVIATKFGVALEDLQTANDLSDEFIYQDQVLIIPSASEGGVTAASNVPGGDASRIYEVQAGDTLGEIAARFGVEVEDIKMANGMSSDIIQSGQELVIPSGD